MRLRNTLITALLFLLAVSVNAQVRTIGGRLKIKTVNELASPTGTTKVLVLDNEEVKFVEVDDLPVGGGTLTGADNGLSVNGTTVEIGGTLIKTTDVVLNSNPFSFTGNTTLFNMIDNTGVFELYGQTRILFRANASEGFRFSDIAQTNYFNLLPPDSGTGSYKAPNGTATRWFGISVDGNFADNTGNMDLLGFDYTGDVVTLGTTGVNAVTFDFNEEGLFDFRGDQQSSLFATIRLYNAANTFYHEFATEGGETGNTVQTYQNKSGTLAHLADLPPDFDEILNFTGTRSTNLFAQFGDYDNSDNGVKLTISQTGVNASFSLINNPQTVGFVFNENGNSQLQSDGIWTQFADGTTNIQVDYDDNSTTDEFNVTFNGSGTPLNKFKVKEDGDVIAGGGNFVDTDGTEDDTGTAISLEDNITGIIYNYTTPSTSDTFTTTNLKQGGFAEVYVDTTGDTDFPTVTGGTLREGAIFVAGKDFKMIIYSPDGTAVDYYFLKYED